MTRRRRLTRLASLVGVAVVVLAALLISRGGAEERAPAELASDQWQRLQRKIAQAAEARRDRRPAEVGLETSGASPESLAAAATLPRIPIASSGPATPSSRAPLGGDVLARQAAEYAASRPKSVIELQQFRRTTRARVADERGRGGEALLINLSPRINFWYLLQLTWDGEATVSYHLTNSQPEAQELILDADFPEGLLFEGPRGRTGCALWSTEASPSLAEASQLSTPYVTLCGDEIVLRRPTAGRRTKLEWATDLLRDKVWGGETLTVLVRDSLYQDANLVRSELIAGGAGPDEDAAQGQPAPARIEPRHAGDLMAPVALGLALESPETRVRVGAWYPALDNPGVFVSVSQPALVATELLESSPRHAGRLDAVEAEALTYLVAFDLSQFEVDFSVGTDHPRVGWADRVRPGLRDASLPGPDGIGDIAPLVAGGIVPYSLAERTVASFTGGFKRSHGAFKSGTLGERASGSHYGFIESGVVLSKLQLGLATVFLLDDGSVEMKTWTREDDALLERIRFARQNGVPIVETDPETGAPVPGALVGRWADGNWSGSQDRRLRSVRAGICLQESAAGRFLLYGYFSSATPTAMARVFQAYGCSYAMITDMNALEHTYLALYRVEDSRLAVDHLIEGMEVLDRVVDGHVLPRFLGFADNRDFFYVVRRPSPAVNGPQSAAPEVAAVGMSEAK